MVQEHPDPISGQWPGLQKARARMPKQSVDEHMGARLTLMREERGISPKDFAKRIGLPPARLRLFEAGRASMPASLLLQIAEELSAPIGHFFAELIRENDQIFEPLAIDGHESEELSRAFLSINSLSVRKGICALVRAVAAQGRKSSPS